MAAPIQRYNDPRLYGTTLVKPFNESYQWIRTAAHPLHPKCSRVTECAFKAMKIVSGTIALVITAIPALVGRIIQIIHYHSISNEIRLKPPTVKVNGMELPELQKCSMSPSKKYHGTKDITAMSILRWGFDPNKTGLGSKMGNAAYVSVGDTVSVTYGNCQIVLSLDLEENEIAYLDNNPYQQLMKNKNLEDKTTMVALRELFYQNGYRAIKYDLNHYGIEEAFAVYDPSCISIDRIQSSPNAVAPAAIETY